MLLNFTKKSKHTKFVYRFFFKNEMEIIRYKVDMAWTSTNKGE